MSEGALLRLVEGLDRAWLERRFEDLAEYFAEDAVLVAPGGRDRLAGGPAIVESYRSFMARAEVTRFEPGAPTITRHGDTAIIEYRWSMDWRDGDGAHAADGGEVLVLAWNAAGWQIVWRTQIAE